MSVKFGIKKNFNILKHFFKLTTEIDKTFIPLVVVSAILKSVYPFIGIVIPKFIIDELDNHKRVEILLGCVVAIFVLSSFIKLLDDIVNNAINKRNILVIKSFNLLMGEKIMSLDYENIENPEILNMKERAMQPINQLSCIENTVDFSIDLLSKSISAFGLLGIICLLNPVIIIVIIITLLINSLIMKKSKKHTYELYGYTVPVNRHSKYYYSLAEDFSMGKDIRLYDMAEFIYNKIRAFNKKSVGFMKDTFVKISHLSGLSGILLNLQNMFIYVYIAYKVLSNHISLGDFTLYTSAVTKFSSCLTSIFNALISLNQMARYLENFIKIEDMPSRNFTGDTPVSTIENIEIEFRNVSFKYPRSNNYTLKNINFKINSGEKISVVGMNGAGKTTFIKLLCRLYVPTSGEILFNGIDINEYDYKEYQQILAVVFQDYKLFSFSLKDNVFLGEEEVAADIDVIDALNKAGFGEDLKKLDKGIDTSIYKNFDKKGVEFSGGQSQKIAIARVLYKDSPVMILDEPTAALDPFTEHELYTNFREIAKGKTVIFISHRLSSCRFSDKIVVFKDGEIIEYGTHEELVHKEGHYNTLYSSQAQYYL